MSISIFNQPDTLWYSSELFCTPSRASWLGGGRPRTRPLAPRPSSDTAPAAAGGIKRLGRTFSIELVFFFGGGVNNEEIIAVKVFLKNNPSCLLVVVGRLARVAVAGGPVVEVSHGVTAVVAVVVVAVVAAATVVAAVVVVVVAVVGQAQVVEVVVGGLVAGAGALHGRGTEVGRIII